LRWLLKKTGLGKRIALTLIKRMGRKTLTLGLMGIICPYATGPSPVYYGSGYLPSGDYWRLGAIFGVIFLGVLLLVGTPWLFALR